jgi:mediator of RNA polymerase II transcription subunit 16
MVSKEMPLLLDNDIPMQLTGAGDVGDVDDLFGDASALPLRPAIRHLDERLDILRNRGCCQTVAWSRVGTVASVTPDGQELELRFLRSHPANGEWELSEPVICSLVRGSNEFPLVHLEWAGTNNPELAIFDAGGRVALLIFSTTLTHPFVVRRWDADIVDELQSLAGCHWLPVAASNPNTSSAAGSAGIRQSYNVMFGPATRNPNGSYHYESSFIHAEGPSHPLPARTALLTVSMGGTLKMLFMQMNNKLEETTLELESISTVNEIVTHAAFASEKKYLILALATSARQLKFVKVDIQWGAQPGKTGPQNARFNATLSEKHCATASCPVDSAEDASSSHITHLLALPSLLDNSGKNVVPPQVIAVRSRAPNPGSFSAPQTVIDRWEAVEQRHPLHPAVEQLGNRGNNNSSDATPGLCLRPLEPTVLPKTIIGIQSIQFGKVIVFTYFDGTVEYRDRFNFQEIYTDQDTSTLSNLRQVGWRFPDDGPCRLF